MSLVRNTAQGQTSGTQLTVANSGGGSGDALDLVSPSNTAAIVFSNAFAKRGTQSFKVDSGGTGTAFFSFTRPAADAGALAGWVYLSGSPSGAAQTLVQVRNTANAQMASIAMKTTGQLYATNANGNQLVGDGGVNQTAALTAGFYHLSLRAVKGTTTSDGVIAWQILDSTGTVLVSGQVTGNATTAQTNIYRFGKTGGNTIPVMYWDDVAADDGRLTLIPPASDDQTQTLPRLTLVAATRTVTPAPGATTTTLPRVTNTPALRAVAAAPGVAYGALPRLTLTEMLRSLTGSPGPTTVPLPHLVATVATRSAAASPGPTSTTLPRAMLVSALRVLMGVPAPTVGNLPRLTLGGVLRSLTAQQGPPPGQTVSLPRLMMVTALRPLLSTPGTTVRTLPRLTLSRSLRSLHPVPGPTARPLPRLALGVDTRILVPDPGPTSAPLPRLLLTAALGILKRYRPPRDVDLVVTVAAQGWPRATAAAQQRGMTVAAQSGRTHVEEQR